MYADAKELKQMQRRVERRVRGRVLYVLHVGIAAICVLLSLFAIFVNMINGYGAMYGMRAILAPLQIIPIFGFTLGVHTLVRWVNHMAQRMRNTEMQRELQQAGYYGEIEKRKHEAATFARLSDDGELVYNDNDASSVDPYYNHNEATHQS